MSQLQRPISLEYILLGFICENPIHGYDLFKKINEFEGISLVWKVKQGTVYTMLEKLEEAGLITAQVISNKNHISRREYAITALGEVSFFTWITTPVNQTHGMRQEFLAKLFFCQKVNVEISKELIEKQRALCSTWLSDLMLSFYGTKASQLYEKMIYKYQIAQVQAAIDWLEFCDKEIGNGIASSSSFILQQDRIPAKSG